MKTWLVTVTYSVEADTERDAMEAVDNGEGAEITIDVEEASL